MTEKNGDDDKWNHVFISFSDEAMKSAADFDRNIRERLVKNMIELTAEEHKKLVQQIALLNANMRQLQPPKRSSPPATAAFLLAFVAPKNLAQALLGDLEEIFQKNAERFGDSQARRMYWLEVARSFGPLAWQWIKRMGLITFLVDYFRSKFGL